MKTVICHKLQAKIASEQVMKGLMTNTRSASIRRLDEFLLVITQAHA